MQWNNDIGYQQPQQDVYANASASYSANPFTQDGADTQEFSLASIQQRLGALSSVEENDAASVSPDAMPSTQTLNMSYQRDYSAEKTRVASKLSTKQKVLVASYVIVVLALIVAVTLCSVSVTNTFGVALADNAQYSEQASQIEDLTAQLAEEDFEELNRRATELGYVDASRANTMTYTELETRPAQNFSVESNWFDSLCDWLCNAFGG